MKTLILGLIVLMYLVNLIITLLNDRHSRQPIPAQAQGIYNQEQYAKWLAYSMVTLRFGLITQTLMTVLLLALLAFGAFGALERLANSWVEHPILQTLAFLGVFWLFNWAINLPFEYYATFVIEEKFGFNKTTRKIFFTDTLKSLLLMALLGGGLTALLHFLYLTFSQQLWGFILAAWATLSLVTLLLFVLNTKVFVKLFNKLTPLPEGELKDNIQALAQKVGFNISAISVMDASKRSTKLNAFFSGLGKTREVVLFDTLLEKLQPQEILAVLAHELGHAIHKDLPRALAAQIVVFGLYAALIGSILQAPALAQAFGLSGVHFGFALLLLGILLEPVTLLLGIPLNAISRRAEYAADAFAAQTAGSAPMQSALRVLAQENLANLNPHPLYVLLHYNHPSIPQRLKAIEK